MTEHVHTIESVYEGPLWFCACGAEFFPKQPSKSLPVAQPIRINLNRRYP